MSFESIKVVLETRQFAALLGLDEDTWLEAKGRNPYNLDTPAGRYELAKDVTAFAVSISSRFSFSRLLRAISTGQESSSPSRAALRINHVTPKRDVSGREGQGRWLNY